MRRLLHWLNRTFVFFIGFGLLTWSGIEALITKEVGIYGWGATSLLAGFGLHSFTNESNPSKFWAVTLFYLLAGVACGIVFVLKIKARKRNKQRFHQLLH